MSASAWTGSTTSVTQAGFKCLKRKFGLVVQNLKSRDLFADGPARQSEPEGGIARARSDLYALTCRRGCSQKGDKPAYLPRDVTQPRIGGVPSTRSRASITSNSCVRARYRQRYVVKHNLSLILILEPNILTNLNSSPEISRNWTNFFWGKTPARSLDKWRKFSCSQNHGQGLARVYGRAVTAKTNETPRTQGEYCCADIVRAIMRTVCYILSNL